MDDDPVAVDFLAEERGQAGGVGLVFFHDVVEAGEDQSGVGGDHGGFDVREIQVGFDDGGGVAFFERGPALGDAGGDGESEFRGVVESEHKCVQVVGVPCLGRVVHHLLQFAGELGLAGRADGLGLAVAVAAEGGEGQGDKEQWFHRAFRRIGGAWAGVATENLTECFVVGSGGPRPGG